MEDNTPKPRAYVNVGIGPTFRDLAQRMAQLKNAIEGTKLSLRAYLEGLIQADATVQQSVLPGLSLQEAMKGDVRLKAVDPDDDFARNDKVWCAEERLLDCIAVTQPPALVYVLSQASVKELLDNETFELVPCQSGIGEQYLNWSGEKYLEVDSSGNGKLIIKTNT